MPKTSAALVWCTLLENQCTLYFKNDSIHLKLKTRSLDDRHYRVNPLVMIVIFYVVHTLINTCNYLSELNFMSKPTVIGGGTRKCRNIHLKWFDNDHISQTLKVHKS